MPVRIYQRFNLGSGKGIVFSQGTGKNSILYLIFVAPIVFTAMLMWWMIKYSALAIYYLFKYTAIGFYKGAKFIWSWIVKLIRFLTDQVEKYLVSREYNLDRKWIAAIVSGALFIMVTVAVIVISAIK